MVNYEVPRCSKMCVATNRELKPGEWFYSVLLEDRGQIKRLDWSQDGWQGSPAQSLPTYQPEDGIDVIGWWKSRLPMSNDNKVKLAPNVILLNLFDQLGEQIDKQEMRYVLVLLLIRRRILRLEKEESNTETGQKTLTVYCPKREATYRIPVTSPNDEQIEQIQQTLTALLYAG